jgi:hypothetical protein
VVPTLRLCVLYGSQNKQQLSPYKTFKRLVFITEVESVYSAVRTESLYKTDRLRLYRVKVMCSKCNLASLVRAYLMMSLLITGN